MARTRGLQPATGPNRDGATCAALAGTFSFGSSGSKQQEQESRLARIVKIAKIAKIANSLRVERGGGSKSMIQLHWSTAAAVVAETQTGSLQELGSAEHCSGDCSTIGCLDPLGRNSSDVSMQ